MTHEPATPRGPDLTLGVSPADLEDGKLLGHVGEHDVLLVRSGPEVFAVGALCTHYNGPLAEGLVVGDTIRCPWHHASFGLRTGEPLRAPALQPISCWAVERSDDKIFVRERRAQPKPAPRRKRSESDPDKIVIVGGGAAASSC
jgi:nitrite reductase/ring-hydroxylating ferredoxin subunit